MYDFISATFMYDFISAMPSDRLPVIFSHRSVTHTCLLMERLASVKGTETPTNIHVLILTKLKRTEASSQGCVLTR